jgi:hypothetical protein
MFFLLLVCTLSIIMFKANHKKLILRELKHQVQEDLRRIKSFTPLLLLLGCSTLQPTSRTITYNIKCMQRYDYTNRTLSMVTFLNDKPCRCWCGNPPVFIFIAYGHLEMFCLQHTRQLFELTNEEYDVEKLQCS